MEGRFFSPDQPTDSFALILNEAAVRAFGFDKPLEKRLIVSLGEEVEPRREFIQNNALEVSVLDI